jgi:hypothetical protein
MHLMSSVFIAMGETNPAHFARTGTSGDWVYFGPIPFATAINPTSSTMRFIVTPSDRFGPSVNPDRAFPVGGMYWNSRPIQLPDGTPLPVGWYIKARNSDTVAAGGVASFFWLAIDEGQAPVIPAGIPLNQKLIGQPANFGKTNTSGDHQVFPNIFNPPGQVGLTVANLLATNPPYSFTGTIGSTTISTFGTALAMLPAPIPPSGAPVPPATPQSGRPLVFVTANNAGCGVSPAEPTHNAAAVGLVVDQGSGAMTPAGFKLVARNADVAGTCGFNWVALLPTTATRLAGTFAVPMGAPQPLNLFVDTGIFPPPPMEQFNFNQAGTAGDWASAEIQFSAPFVAEPVVLVTPKYPPPSFPGPGETGLSSCAPIGVVQNVTRYGFTLAVRNTDSNHLGGNASFYWVAFAPPD